MDANYAGNDQISVEFTYANTGRQVKFSTNKGAKFDDVLNYAYKELDEMRKPSDNFFCINGTLLKGYLDMTIQYVIDNLCKSADFQIRGPTGGASFFEEI